MKKKVEQNTQGVEYKTLIDPETGLRHSMPIIKKQSQNIVIMNNETKRQSVFMQMHNGTRMGEGSFNQGLKELFYIAGPANKRKLVEAFPEFFGDEVPEFGIIAEKPNKVNYKGWLIKWNKGEEIYDLYTPDEMEQPAGFREVDIQVGSIAAAKAHIDNF